MSNEKKLNLIDDGSFLYVNNGFDIKESLLLLVRNIKLISIITSIFGLLSVIFALSLTDQYTARATLTQSDDQKNDLAGLSSSFSSLSSIAGVNLKDGGADKTQIFIEVLRSYKFFNNILDKNIESVLVPIVATQSIDKISREPIINTEIYNYEKQEFIGEIPSRQELYKIYLESILTVNRDKKTDIVTIGVTHKSPVFAAFLTDKLILEVNEYMRKDDMNDAIDALDYLSSELDKKTNQVIQNTIAGLMEKQLQKKMVSQIRSQYTLKYIEPPYAPERKSRPFRALICIFITSLGFILACLYILSNSIYKRIKEKNIDSIS